MRQKRCTIWTLFSKQKTRICAETLILEKGRCFSQKVADFGLFFCAQVVVGCVRLARHNHPYCSRLTVHHTTARRPVMTSIVPKYNLVQFYAIKFEWCGRNEHRWYCNLIGPYPYTVVRQMTTARFGIVHQRIVRLSPVGMAG